MHFLLGKNKQKKSPLWFIYAGCQSFMSLYLSFMTSGQVKTYSASIETPLFSPDHPTTMWCNCSITKEEKKVHKRHFAAELLPTQLFRSLESSQARQIRYNMHSSSSWRRLLGCFWSLTGRQQAVSLEHALYYQALSSILLVFYLEGKKIAQSTCLHKYLILLQSPCLELLRCLAEGFSVGLCPH